MDVRRFFPSPRLPVHNTEDVRGAAVFGTPKAMFRYALLREWSDGPRAVAFCGVNPSTATEDMDDRTVTRCWKFARRWGYDCMVMLNAFAFRSTDPNGLNDAEDPVGPDNDVWLLRIHSEVEKTVVAWGNNVTRLPGRHERVLTVLSAAKTPIVAFDVTNDGYPKHPLSRGLHRIPDTAVPKPYVFNVGGARLVAS